MIYHSLPQFPFLQMGIIMYPCHRILLTDAFIFFSLPSSPSGQGFAFAFLTVASPVPIEDLIVVQLLSHVQPSHPLSPSSPTPSVFPSYRVFSSESALHIRWSKYWSFSFSISPSSEYSGLISFRVDCFDLLAVQGTLKNLLQHHS